MISFQIYHPQSCIHKQLWPPEWGGQGFAYHVTSTEIKSPVFTVERESYLVIEKQQVSNGICGQLEPNGFLVVTYQSVLESL